MLPENWRMNTNIKDTALVLPWKPVRSATGSASALSQPDLQFTHMDRVPSPAAKCLNTTWRRNNESHHTFVTLDCTDVLGVYM